MFSHFQEINWRQHAVGLPFFIAALVFFCFAYFYHASAEEGFKTARQQLNNQKQSAEFAAQQMEMYQRYHPAFEKLQRNGAMGGNFRLDWLESLQGASEYYEIPNIDFTLENAVPAEELKDHYWNSEVSFTSTIMTLRLKLLHEGDWYHLLRYLHRNAKGVFSAESCELRREDAGDQAYAGLNGVCELKWYSIVDPMESLDEQDEI